MYKGLNFQFPVCNGCQDILMKSMNLNSAAILIICGVDYWFITFGIGKSEAVNLFKNADFSEKSYNVW